MQVSSGRVDPYDSNNIYKGIAKRVGNETSGIREGANSENNVRNIDHIRL